MLDVEDTWQQRIRPWLVAKSEFSYLQDWGSDYCFDKLLQAVKESPAYLPVVHGLLTKNGITYYFLAVEDPAYERWHPMCYVSHDDDFSDHIFSCLTPVLVLRKSVSELGYLDAETLEFSPAENGSRFIWVAGFSENTPIRVIDKSQTYISSLIKKAKRIYADSLMGLGSGDNYFARDVLSSAARLLPHWGSKKMFDEHLPTIANVPEWATLNEAKAYEKEIQQDLVEWLESLGHTVKVHPKNFNRKIPDLLVDNKILVEVKRDLGTHNARLAIGQVQGYPGEYTRVIAGLCKAQI